MDRRKFAAIAPFIAMCLFRCASVPAAAQNPRERIASLDLYRAIDLDLHDASLDEAISQLAHKYGVFIVADGRPLVSAATIVMKGNLREGLDRVGSGFDYAWNVGRNGTVLLHKRFTDPADRPQLHLAELRASVHDIVSILPDVPPDASDYLWSRTLVNLSRDLSAEQVDSLKNGHKLAAKDLTPQQRNMLKEAILIRGFGVPKAAWLTLATVLNGIERSVVRIQQAAADLHGQRTVSSDVVNVVPTPAGEQESTRLGSVTVTRKER